MEDLADKEKDWSVRKLAEWTAIGGRGPILIGSPTTVADKIEEWVNESDIDGFNIAYLVAHESFEKIIEHLIPELQRRGIYPNSYQEGTLREKIFGHRLLAKTHPAQKYRTKIDEK